MLFRSVCRDLGQSQIPVVAGADRPLYANPYWRENPIRPWPGAEASPFTPNQALEFLRATIRAHPGEITLITIGQFTNLAMLLLVDPDAVAMLKGVVSMGGRMNYPADQPQGECNVILDPIAAGIAFQRLGEQLLLLPIDAVRGHSLSESEVVRMLDRDDRDAVRQTCWGWEETRKGKKGVGLADPMTCAMVFDPRLVNCAPGTVRLTLHDHAVPGGEPFEDDEVIGITAFAESANGPHSVVRSIHPEQAHAHLLEVFR